MCSRSSPYSLTVTEELFHKLCRMTVGRKLSRCQSSFGVLWYILSLDFRLVTDVIYVLLTLSMFFILLEKSRAQHKIHVGPIRQIQYFSTDLVFRQMMSLHKASQTQQQITVG